MENRSRAVAVVVSADAFEEFEAWRASRDTRTVGTAFAELRSLAGETGYRLPLPPRRDRRNAFTGSKK